MTVPPSLHDSVLVDITSVLPCAWAPVAAAWHRQHPSLRWALALDLRVPEQEFALVRDLGRIFTATIHTSKLTHELLVELLHAKIPRRAAQLQHGLEQRLGDFAVVEADAVWDLLYAAPVIRNIDEWATTVYGSYYVLWSRLTNAGQRPPKQLVTAFRLLWAVQLQAQGETIAHGLELPTARAGYRLGGSFNLGLKDIQRLELGPMLDVYAAMVLRSQRDSTLLPTTLPSLAEVGSLLR